MKKIIVTGSLGIIFMAGSVNTFRDKPFEVTVPHAFEISQLYIPLVLAE